MRTADADSRRGRKQDRARFTSGRKAEAFYAQKLRGIARHIGAIVRAFPIGSPDSARAIKQAMQGYSETLKPWAEATGRRMLEDVARRDKAAWARLSQEMARSLKLEIETTPIGDMMKAMLARQVALITSLPLDAAQRVHDLTMKAMVDGSRAREVASDILRTSDVTVSRANLIARTEVARTSTALTQARALHVGSEGYIWRTSRDGTVRPSPYDMSPKEFAKMNTKARGSHRLLEGTFHRWDQPPISGSAGERSHPGCIYNCRCYAEVVLPGVLK